jgi:hypothetical protein
MMLCISETFARDSRLAAIRSPEWEVIVAPCYLSGESPDPSKIEKPEIADDVIRVDEDHSLSAFTCASPQSQSERSPPTGSDSEASRGIFVLEGESDYTLQIVSLSWMHSFRNSLFAEVTHGVINY